MAQRRQRGLFDPDAKPGTSPFDHHVYVIASDGDMQEGVTHEACALAGHQELGNLTARLRRQPDLDRGRHRHRVQRGRGSPLHGIRLARRRGRLAQGRRRRDLRRGRRRPARRHPRRATRSATSRPSSCCTRSSRGPRRRSRTPASRTARPSATRRSAPPRSCSASTPRSPSSSSPPCSSRRATSSSAARPPTASGTRASRPGARPTPTARRCSTASSPARRPTASPRRCPPSRPTRRASPPARASGKVLTAIADVMPELWGGSADLAESNNTTMEGQPSFVPSSQADVARGRAAPSVARCTSASARTAWA